MLIEFCVERRIAALVLVLALGGYGVYSYTQTPIEAFPDVTNYQVNVIGQLPGLAPEEIERQLTLPLERALNGTPGAIDMRSESLFGLSLIFLTFDDDVDTFKARTMVAQRLADADLPEGAQAGLAPDATPLGQIFQFVVVSDRHDLAETRGALEWDIKRVLLQVPGVADVSSLGGLLKEIHVEVDPDKLIAFGVTLTDVTDALTKANKNVGGGFLRRGEQELVVRSIGSALGPRDLEEAVIKASHGTPVRVGDVARVMQSNTPIRGAVGYNDDLNVASAFVLLRRGENPSVVLDGVHAKVKELNEKILPEGMKIVPFYDRSELVGHTLDTVYDNLLHGFLLIAGVVWLFLRSLRASSVVAIVIPLSLLGAFIGLYSIRLPANLISMGAVDFGIIVDGAIVLVENVIHRARNLRPASAAEMRRIVVEAAVDVGKPTLYAMSIIIAALIPIFSLQRIEGRIFRPVAMTYSFALIAALILTFTLVPALCALVLRPKDVDGEEPHFVDIMRAMYRAALTRIVTAPAAVLVVAACAGVAGVAGGAGLGREFLPELNEGDLDVFVEMPASISLEDGQRVLLEVRKRLLAFPEVTAVLSQQGHPEDGTDDKCVNMGETFVKLKPRDAWPMGVTQEKLRDLMRSSLEQIPGVNFNMSQPIKDNVEEAMAGVKGKIVLKIFGNDLDKMHATLEQAMAVLKGIDGVVDLELYRDVTVPQLQIRPDRAALARNGVAMSDAQATIETALAGKVVTNLYEGDRVVPVRVRLPRLEAADVDLVGNLLVPASTGARVPLSALANIDVGRGIADINREQSSRFIALKFNVEGRDIASVIHEAQAAVAAKVKPPEGHYFVWTGEFENQERAMKRLAIIVPIALVVVMLLMCSALGKVRDAAVVLGLAPVALSGGVAALAIAGIPLSVSAAVGFIALLGQVSLMGLLVLSAIQQSGVVDGASARLRSVTMAALLAILGLLPMAISTGVGSETQRPFALVIVGGLVTTWLTSVFVLPALVARLSKRAPR